MTIDEFSKQMEIGRKTVLKWLQKDWIPGADLEKNYVPDYARAPYTEARAKTVTAIAASILKATYHCKQILPQFYHISQTDFEHIVSLLIEKKLIQQRTTDGVRYLDITANGAEMLSNKGKMIAKKLSVMIPSLADIVINVVRLTN